MNTPQNWKKENEKLIRGYVFPNFADAMIFVNRVAEIAEELNHHPDILIHHYNQVRLEIYHHDGKPLDTSDQKLAETISLIPPNY